MAEEPKQEQITAQETEEEAIVEMPEEEQIETTEVKEAETQAEEEAPETEVKEKPKRKKKEEEIVEERFYTIPLQKALVRPPKKRAPRAMQLVKLFVTKHMKLEMRVTEEEEEEELPQLVISQEVNEKIWGRGIEKPPRRIKTRVTKDKDGNVTVFLAENK
jgi:large subunit ribosomal protein L31e